MKQTHQQLLDEIQLREASLADAQRELAAGELTAIQAATIEAREELALMRLRQELSNLGSPSAKAPSRNRRTSLLILGIICLLAVMVIVVYSSLSLRQSGGQITGNVSLSGAQQVTQDLNVAQSDVAEGNVAAALQEYQSVLTLDPKNVSALTETGWLDFSAGSSATNPSLVAIGVQDLRRSDRLRPAQRRGTPVLRDRGRLDSRQQGVWRRVSSKCSWTYIPRAPNSRSPDRFCWR